MIYQVLYLLAGITTIYAEDQRATLLMYVSKVMLMPLLAMYFYYHSKNISKYKFIYLALFFCWLGDIFLMFPRGESYPNSKLFFICGLGAFLIGHLNYIVHFISEVKTKIKLSYVVKSPYLVLPFILYIVVLLRLLYPTLGTMKSPVTIYSIIIILMLLAALNRKNVVNSTSFYFVFVGAIFFVFSDSCIAINLFYEPFELARMTIMSTYIVAQLIIIKGVLEARVS